MPEVGKGFPELARTPVTNLCAASESQILQHSLALQEECCATVDEMWRWKQREFVLFLH